MGQIITRRNFLKGLFTTAAIVIPSTKLIFDLAPQSFKEIKYTGSYDEIFKRVYGEYADNLYSETPDMFFVGTEYYDIMVKHLEDHERFVGIPVNFSGGEKYEINYSWK